MKRIVVDLETSGLIPGIHQFLSIGAVNFDTGETFYGECRIYDRNKISPTALKINGFTEQSCRDKKKQTPYQLYVKFMEWIGEGRHLMMGQNIGHFDILFLERIHLSLKNKSPFPFRYQTIDLHTAYYTKYQESLGMASICEALDIEPEPDIHNALTGALKEYECFKKLL